MPCTVLAELCRDFGRPHDHGDVTLHRLRHTIATVLVTNGDLQARQRLGHKDVSTTFRQWCHPPPLHDQDVADRLEDLYSKDRA
jgi:integrase